MLTQKICSQIEKTKDCQVKPPRAGVTSPLAPPTRKNRIGKIIPKTIVNGSQNFKDTDGNLSCQSAILIKAPTKNSNIY